MREIGVRMLCILCACTCVRSVYEFYVYFACVYVCIGVPVLCGMCTYVCVCEIGIIRVTYLEYLYMCFVFMYDVWAYVCLCVLCICYSTCVYRIRVMLMYGPLYKT